MKRLITLLAVLAILFTCSVTASAAASATMTIAADTTCAPGSTVKLSFGLAAGSNVAAANFEVTYDTDTFEFVNYENGGLIENAMAVGNCNNGIFKFALAGMTPIVDEGVLFTVEFKVDAKASGEHLFYLYTTSCCDENFNDITAETQSVTMTVSGEAVSDITVTPVTSKDKNGKEYVVSADNGESATGVLVKDAIKNNGSAKTWIFAGVIILLVAGVGFLVVAAIARAKKNEENEPELESILDDEAKEMLDVGAQSPASDDDELE